MPVLRGKKKIGIKFLEKFLEKNFFEKKLKNFFFFEKIFKKIIFFEKI